MPFGRTETDRMLGLFVADQRRLRMGFLTLCQDNLVTTLRDVFHANIVRTPEARIQPLAVVASTKRQSDFRGALLPLLKGRQPIHVALQTSRMADVSGKHSRQVSLDLGLQVLEGFLKGFGLPAAGISAKFAGASSVSFVF